MAAQNSNITTASLVLDETGTSKKEHPLKTAQNSKPAANIPDFELQNCGSLFLLRPLNSAAKEWMQGHLPVDSPETQFWGDAIVIEPRYVTPIVDGIIGDGLVLR
jgi:hypothetical protein